MEEPDYERKLVRLPEDAQGLGGVLFVEGFSECGVELHLVSEPSSSQRPCCQGGRACSRVLCGQSAARYFKRLRWQKAATAAQ